MGVRAIGSQSAFCFVRLVPELRESCGYLDVYGALPSGYDTILWDAKR